MTALNYIASAVLRHGAQQTLLHRHVANNVDVSEYFIGYTWYKVRISCDKGCFAGRTAKRDSSITMGYSGSTSWYFHV